MTLGSIPFTLTTTYKWYNSHLPHITHPLALLLAKWNTYIPRAKISHAVRAVLRTAAYRAGQQLIVHASPEKDNPVSQPVTNLYPFTPDSPSPEEQAPTLALPLCLSLRILPSLHHTLCMSTT